MKINSIPPTVRNKVAIYIRVSTVYQVDRDSLPMQRSDLIAYCKLILETENYEIFEDAGYSGKNVDRPAFQEMMKRVRDGEFTHILVWKIDRISRNLLDFANMYQELKTLGVTFVSKNEQFQTNTAMGEAMLKIILVFAELERNMTSERVTATMIDRASKGIWNGGRIPYGYNYDYEKKEFILNGDEAPVVKLIFDLYLEHRSLVYIVKYLDEKQIRQLERAVSGYFDYIEDLVERENAFTMQEFSDSINAFLEFRKYDILKDNGKISHQQALEKAYGEYDIYNKLQPIESDFDRMIENSSTEI